MAISAVPLQVECKRYGYSPGFGEMMLAVAREGLDERKIANALSDGIPITSHKPTFYEQVTSVKIHSLSRSLLLPFHCLLLSTLFLFALLMSCLGASSVPVGVREESRCCHLSVGL
ncbi:MAG TPA: hypothetical protein VHZ52_07445, partial [Acidobacteriaceae bacterium]|nr:hypothetical protein [Acidobacteriaceae bacterium]